MCHSLIHFIYHHWNIALEEWKTLGHAITRNEPVNQQLGHNKPSLFVDYFPMTAHPPPFSDFTGSVAIAVNKIFIEGMLSVISFTP